MKWYCERCKNTFYFYYYKNIEIAASGAMIDVTALFEGNVREFFAFHATLPVRQSIWGLKHPHSFLSNIKKTNVPIWSVMSLPWRNQLWNMCIVFSRIFPILWRSRLFLLHVGLRENLSILFCQTISFGKSTWKSLYIRKYESNLNKLQIGISEV